jgi:hypothetical protein
MIKVLLRQMLDCMALPQGSVYWSFFLVVEEYNLPFCYIKRSYHGFESLIEIELD